MDKAHFNRNARWASFKNLPNIRFRNQNHPNQPRSQIEFLGYYGQKSIRPFWRNYYEETDAIVWVIDSTDSDRLETCKTELESVLNADVEKKEEE